MVRFEKWRQIGHLFRKLPPLGRLLTADQYNWLTFKNMLLSWIDNRTLFACQTLLTAVYTIVFLSMGRMHRHLPGTGSFALVFFQVFSDAS
jgi:hypothetical protein